MRRIRKMFSNKGSLVIIVFGLFIVFNREDINKSMNSRIDTLINIFKLSDRNYNGKITSDNLNHDYSDVFDILEIKREEAKSYLKDALNKN